MQRLLDNGNRCACDYYLTSDKDTSPGKDYLVNLLHYDNASSACILILNYHSTKINLLLEKIKKIYS